MVQTSVIDKIENDDFLKNFLHGDNSESALAAQKHLSFPEQIRKLTDGLDLISSELKQKIRHDYPNLIKHSANASKLMVALESLNDDLAGLHRSVDSLKQLVYAPYEKLEKQIQVCERLHNTSQLMRKIERFLQLHRRLKETPELSKQALLVFELDGLVGDKELCRIEMLVDERAAVINTKQRLVHIANRELASGIQDGNEEAIAKSLEIFRNLDMLGTFLSNQIESYANDIRQSIKQCFNGADLATLQKMSIKESPSSGAGKAKLPGRVPNLSTSMNFKAKLLAGLEWLLTDELATYCEQVIAIDRCLRKLTSGIIGENPGRDFLARFSRTISELLRTSFAESPVHVLQNLQQSLPKLLAHFNALHGKTGGELELSRDIFASLHAGYIEKCAATLKVSSAETALTEATVDQMIKNATAELTVSLIDEELLASVVGVLIACNSDFVTKVRASVRSAGDADQVVALPNAAQLANIAAANLLHYHATRVEAMLVSLELEKRDRGAAERIKRGLDEGHRVTLGVLRALLSQIMAHVGNILLSMHREPSLNADNINVTAASLYMGEFRDFLTRAWSSHIAPFTDTVAVSKITTELVTRTVELFVQNVAIVRPISERGRQRMRSDCGHLENALQTVVAEKGALSGGFRTLRSLAACVVETPEALAGGEHTLIPAYAILLMLFGHAAEELKSPHRAAGWSEEKLIAWLHEHKERERLELVSGALLKYRNHVRERNRTQYDPVYPLISKMLEECMRQFQQPVARGLL